MTNNKARLGFLAVLTFIVFIVPLLLADEVSLLTNWLFIFASWFIIIALSALPSNHSKSKKKDKNQTELQTNPSPKA